MKDREMKDREKNKDLRGVLLAIISLINFAMFPLTALYLSITSSFKKPENYTKEYELIIDFFLKYEMFIHMGFILFIIGVILFNMKIIKKLQLLKNADI